MVRKKELKERAIYVYPPAEIAQRWKEQERYFIYHIIREAEIKEHIDEDHLD
jgi:hypothetical protein